MKEITFARVDDRLIHGEVVTAWVPTYRINHIIIVDDTVARDPFQRRVLKTLAPRGVRVDPMNVKEAMDYLNGDNNEKERILLLTKSPTYYAKLAENGIQLPQVNLGGMGLRGDRKPFVKNVAADPSEIDAIKKLVAKEVHVFISWYPNNA